MSYKYRNTNTGDIHEVDERDPRLDALDNWVLVKPGDDEVCDACGRGPETIKGDGILSRPGMEPDVAFAEVAIVKTDDAGKQTPTAASKARHGRTADRPTGPDVKAETGSK